MPHIEDDTGVDDVLKHAGVVHEETVERVSRMALARRSDGSEARRSFVLVLLILCVVAFATWWTRPRDFGSTPERTEPGGHGELIYVRADGAAWIASWPPDLPGLPEGASIVLAADTGGTP